MAWHRALPRYPGLRQSPTIAPHQESGRSPMTEPCFPETLQQRKFSDDSHGRSPRLPAAVRSQEPCGNRGLLPVPLRGRRFQVGWLARLPATNSGRSSGLFFQRIGRSCDYRPVHLRAGAPLGAGQRGSVSELRQSIGRFEEPIKNRIRDVFRKLRRQRVRDGVDDGRRLRCQSMDVRAGTRVETD